MKAALSALWRGFLAFNQRAYVHIWGNMLWFVLSIPLVTAPAAWAGLVMLTHRAQTSPPAVEVRTVWEGFKLHFRRGLIVALLNVFILVVNGSNLLAYQNLNDGVGLGLRGFWSLVILLWLMLQFYAWPLLVEMEQPNLRIAFRNAWIMMLRHPAFTLIVGLGALLLMIASTVLVGAWFLIGGSLLAAISVAAVRSRLEAAGLRQAPVHPIIDDIDMTDV
ncbi:MAG: DUF624 domain-containing protein [Anaerolineae bacterium]|nr:DUF624 domain-containing protein [Anaerolineae bacterium]